jgi:putative tricarboxylic transport membrane protein
VAGAGQGHLGFHENGIEVSSLKTVTALDRFRATLPYLVVLAAGLFLYYSAENFEFEQSSGRIGPGAWPKLILILMLASALWGAVSSALNAGQSADLDETDRMEDLARPPELYPWLVWLAVGATLGYLVILPLFGFFLSTIVYAFVLMYLGHYRRFVRVSLLSVAIAFAFMFLFMRVVYVALPVGVAPFDRLSYALMAGMGVH